MHQHIEAVQWRWAYAKSVIAQRDASQKAVTSTNQLPINLTHHHVERADDGGNVGDEAAAT